MSFFCNNQQKDNSVSIDKFLDNIKDYLTIEELERIFDENNEYQSKYNRDDLYNKIKLQESYAKILKKYNYLKSKDFNQHIENIKIYIEENKLKLLEETGKDINNDKNILKECDIFIQTIENIVKNTNFLENSYKISNSEWFKDSYEIFIRSTKRLEENFVKSIEIFKENKKLGIKDIIEELETLDNNKYYLLVKKVNKTNELMDYLKEIQQQDTIKPEDVSTLQTKFNDFINDLDQVTLTDEFNIFKNYIKDVKNEKLKSITEPLKKELQDVDVEKDIQPLEKLINHRIFVFTQHYYYQKTICYKNFLIRLLIITYFFDFTVEEIRSVIEYDLNDNDANVDNIIIACNFLYPNKENKNNIDTNTLFECYKHLPIILGVTIKHIFLEIEFQLRNKDYQLSYKDNQATEPYLQKLSTRRTRDYLIISGFITFLITIWWLWFGCINVSNSRGILPINSFIYTAIPSFLTISLSGFFGMLCFGYINIRINKHAIKTVLDDVRESHFYKENDDKDNDKKILTSTDKLKQKYPTEHVYINVGDYLKKLIRSITTQDATSKSLSHKAKQLKHSIEKIAIITDNQFAKTGKLSFIADFIRDLTIYARNQKRHTSHPEQMVSDSDIRTVENHRNIINQIEAKISWARAKSIFWFFMMPTTIFIFVNTMLSCFSGFFIPLSLYVAVAVCILLLPFGYLGYSGFKYISIHKISYFTGVTGVTGWRKDSTKVEDMIAVIFELVFFFIAVCLLLSLYYLLGEKSFISFFQLNGDLEKQFFYTIISSFLPIEIISNNLKEYSLLLQNDDVSNVLRFIIRLLTIVLTTTLCVKIVRLLIDKYRKYSYDEHSYNAFLPPELLKIFIYFVIFIVATAVIYIVVISEIKNLANIHNDREIVKFECTKNECKVEYKYRQNTNVDKDDHLKTKFSYTCQFNNKNNPPIQSCENTLLPMIKSQGISLSNSNNTGGLSSSDIQLTKTFSFTDFLPYSIFLAIIGAGFALSTRELLENYFSGIAQRVDSSFEEDDMVKIGDSDLMQVKAIGFKNVTFFDINQNAYRYIPFKQLDSEKVMNFTEPTLHFRRNIELFVAKDRGVVTSSPLVANKPVTLRAEMLLLLSAFYVDGVQVPKSKDYSCIKEADIRRRLYQYQDSSNDENGKKSEDTKNTKGSKDVKTLGDVIAEFHLNVEQSDKNYLINQSIFSNFLENKHAEFLKALSADAKDLTDVKEDSEKKFKLYLKSIFDLKNMLGEDSSNQLKQYEERIKSLVLDLERGIDIAKILHTYIRYACERDNVYIDYEKAKVCPIDNQITFSNKNSNEIILTANNNYQKLLIILADKAVEVSYLYYDIALSLWHTKEDNDNFSKNDKRNLDSALLELLNVPRVTSHNIQHHDPIMWQIKLEVTLKLAEQSDEIIHHMNQFIDRNYVVFMGKGKDVNNQSTDKTKT